VSQAQNSLGYKLRVSPMYVSAESANTPVPHPAGIIAKAIRDLIDQQTRMSSSQMLELRYITTSILTVIAPHR